MIFNGNSQGTVCWSLSGEHNRLNALAAIAAARHVGVVPAQAIEALARFENVKRRMEVRGTVGGITVIDDFAHHPTAIATTLAGLRKRVGTARILAVLEPRSNTMKLGVMKQALPGSLVDADLVFGYGAALGWDLAAALAPLGAKARTFESLDALVPAIAAAAHGGDQILVMSNGGFGGVHQRFWMRSIHDLIFAWLSFFASIVQSAPDCTAVAGVRPCCRLSLPAVAGLAARGDRAGIAHCRAVQSGSADLDRFVARRLLRDISCGQLGCAVLLNPIIKPQKVWRQYVGVSTAYHSDQPFEFKQEYVEELTRFSIARITRPERYFLLAATGDEVLDWREMVAHYPVARQRVIAGSDHGLSDFSEYLDDVLSFCGITAGAVQ